MAVTGGYLADQSALARASDPRVGSVLQPLILSDLVATCGIIDLEVLFSARSYDDLVRTRARREHALVRIPMMQADFDRAIDIMAALARRGQHRSA